MAIDWISATAGFLLGAATTAVGTYFGNKYTAQREDGEAKRRLKNEFLGAKRQMSALISELKADLGREDSDTVREFFVLPNRRVALGGSSQRRFVYYEDEHDNLLGKIAILENKGFVHDVTPGNAPVFRMTEEFIECLRRYG